MLLGGGKIKYYNKRGRMGPFQVPRNISSGEGNLNLRTGNKSTLNM
jgi:hypothetical protein